MLIEHVSLGVTAEALRAKIDRISTISLQRCQFDPKFEATKTDIFWGEFLSPLTSSYDLDL